MKQETMMGRFLFISFLAMMCLGVCSGCEKKEKSTPMATPTPFSDVWKDSQSGLTWQVKPTGRTMLWSDAKYYCASLSLGGYNDWRLPTVSELRSLIRGCAATQPGGSCGVTDSCLTRRCRNVECYCSYKGGPDTGGMYWPAELQGDCCWYWSSSAVAENANDRWNNAAWCVDFGDGNVNEGIDFTYFSNARCVR
jgi:hypothetical protein